MAERAKDIVARAHKRFKLCVEWEQDTRQRFKDDIRFLFADSDNQEQWNAAVRARRQIQDQPMVTINKTHTHWLHVVNEGKENKAAVTVHPVGGAATYDSAQIFAGVVRHIELKSDAQTAYDKAREFQVGGGIGYWRIVTDYADENSFDQEIYIRQIPDPLSVYLDPHIKTVEGSDARFGFVFDDMPRDKAEAKYGAVLDKQTFGDGALSWNRKDIVRVAEYYEVIESKEWLYAIEGDEGIEYVRESELPDEARPMLKAAFDQGNAQRRRVDKRTVMHYLIVGDKIVESSTWAGKYIPIIRVPGEEIIIEGKLDRKGMVRYLKDPQRSYNYNASAALEFGALQSKSPYTAPVEAIEGLENYWATANTQNHAYLPYNHADENGNPIPSPERQQPPSSAPVYLEGMQTAERELMMASGQYEATFSEQGNEVSGISLERRQKQGSRVTFHFKDNESKAIGFTGKQLIDLIPKIYDTKRIINILAENGDKQQIQIDPTQKVALQQNKDESEAKVVAIFNPNVGTYDVIAKAGPNFETRREDAFNAMTQLLGSDPQLAQVIGDLYMGNADFPAADKLQERMRNWIRATNPGALGEGPTPQEQQLQQQLQQAMQVIQHLQQELQDKTKAQEMEKQRLDMDALNHLALRMENDKETIVDAFKAETDRFKTLLAALDPEQISAVVRKTLQEMMTAPNPAQNLTQERMDPDAAYEAGMDTVLAPV
jgi:hypothetical protein